MDVKEFIKYCKEEIISYLKDKEELTENDIFVVWSAKVLQNNKALLATNNPNDNLYFECTYNGNKKELYFDVYQKEKNICIQVG